MFFGEYTTLTPRKLLNASAFACVVEIRPEEMFGNVSRNRSQLDDVHLYRTSMIESFAAVAELQSSLTPRMAYVWMESRNFVIVPCAPLVA